MNMSIEDVSGLLTLIGVTIIGIFQIYQVRISYKLNKDIQRFSKGLDQSISRLHRARDAVMRIQTSLEYLYSMDAILVGNEKSAN